LGLLLLSLLFLFCFSNMEVIVMSKMNIKKFEADGGPLGLIMWVVIIVGVTFLIRSSGLLRGYSLPNNQPQVEETLDGR